MASQRLVFVCPDIHSQADVVTITSALAGSPGIDSVEIDHVTGTVVVRTDSGDMGFDVRRRLAGVGFPPDEDATA